MSLAPTRLLSLVSLSLASRSAPLQVAGDTGETTPRAPAATRPPVRPPACRADKKRHASLFEQIKSCG